MTALVLLGAASLAVALPALVASDPYFLYVGAAACLWAALATAWGLLAYAGQVSLGQAAFFGAGAYTSALLAQRAGWAPWLGVLIAGLAGASWRYPSASARIVCAERTSRSERSRTPRHFASSR